MFEGFMEEKEERKRKEQLIEVGKKLQDRRYFARNFVKIVPKGGGARIPFVFNKAQEKVLEAIEEQEREGKPVRILILKGRQMGISVFTLFMGFHHIITHKNKKYGIIAQDKATSKSLFERAKGMYYSLPEDLRPEVNKSNSDEMEFNTKEGQGLGGVMLFEIAGTTERENQPFRGQTLDFLHKSEMAFWGNIPNLDKAMAQSVPDFIPETYIIEESTAKGFNDFKLKWDLASSGGNDFKAIFLSWTLMEEYKKTPPKDFEMSKEEEDIMIKYGLSIEQIYWRNRKIANDFGGDKNRFMEEFPLTPEEAFLASGISVFDKEALKKGLENGEKGKEKRLEDGSIYYEFIEDKIIEKEIYEKEYEYKEGKYIEKEGEKVIGKEYYRNNFCIGIDTAGSGEDMNQVVVMNSITEEVYARYEVKYIPEDILAKNVVELGKKYHNAMLIPETNFSQNFTRELLKLGYKNIYIREKANRIDGGITNEYGWNTNVITKRTLVNDLRMLVYHTYYKIKDIGFYKEAEYYQEEEGKFNAKSGKHDDIIMATGLALQGVRSLQSIKTYTKVNIKNKESGIMLLGEENKKRNKLRKGVYSNNA